MSQSKVTSFYVTRRSSRNQNSKVATNESTKNLVVAKNITLKSVAQEPENEKSKVQENKKVPSKAPPADVKGNKSKSLESKQKSAKRGPKISKKAQSTDVSQSKVTSFYEIQKVSKETNLSTVVENSVHQSPVSDQAVIAENQETCTKSECSLSSEVNCFCCTCKRNVKDTTQNKNISDEKEKTEKCSEGKVLDQDILRSPKRNLCNPYEGTPPKKKTFLSQDSALEKMLSPSKLMTPKKLFSEDETEKKSNELSEKKSETPVKKEVVISKRSEDTKKALENFKAKLALVRSYESNAFKPNSIVSPTQRQEKKSAIPTVPAYQKYSYLVDPDVSSSLILPFKYKLLSEMFKSMDVVISILNNRKEKITFEKVKEGVQRMMKRTFSRAHLGQIMTVMPDAYDVTLEKCTYKKANDPDYQLIVTPKLHAAEGSNKKSNSKNAVMTPQDLSGREKEFLYSLLNLVKQHHQVFLSRLNFPSVPIEKIRRWHPKFAVDSVPDIEAATLPEIPENKVYTAKDVLNKVVKSSLRGKVIKALKSVADESTSSDKKSEGEPSSSLKGPPPTKSALKGVCSDLIAKIRARESAKLLESMVESPDEMKRKAMLERLPKIIQIVWHYFIAERKAAVPIDTAIEKIIHSCSSLSTHEEVKAHLNLITETFPGWLSFIQIPKGLYITINKNKNITEMLDKIQH